MEKELYPILFATVWGEGGYMVAMPIYLQLLPRADTSSLKKGSVCLSVFNNLTSQTRKLSLTSWQNTLITTHGFMKLSTPTPIDRTKFHFAKRSALYECHFVFAEQQTRAEEL